MALRQPRRHQQIDLAGTESRKNLAVTALSDIDDVPQTFQHFLDDTAGNRVEADADLTESNVVVLRIGCRSRARKQ
jgi:hypothetical protein